MTEIPHSMVRPERHIPWCMVPDPTMAQVKMMVYMVLLVGYAQTAVLSQAIHHLDRIDNKTRRCHIVVHLHVVSLEKEAKILMHRPWSWSKGLAKIWNRWSRRGSID